jgi:hypothetical protein
MLRYQVRRIPIRRFKKRGSETTPPSLKLFSLNLDFKL